MTSNRFYETNRNICLMPLRCNAGIYFFCCLRSTCSPLVLYLVFGAFSFSFFFFLFWCAQQCGEFLTAHRVDNRGKPKTSSLSAKVFFLFFLFDSRCKTCGSLNTTMQSRLSDYVQYTHILIFHFISIWFLFCFFLFCIVLFFLSSFCLFN